MARRFRASASTLTLLALSLVASDTAAQVEADAVLRGRVVVGEVPMRSGTVVLHHVSDATQGEVDSTRVGQDGTFAMRLPGVPNPTLGDIYFASVRHQGVMYFGNAVADASQLDSVYQIQVYDTLVAPAEGVPLSIAGRHVFFEADGDAWRITDVFELRNDRDRTVVAGPGGHVWAYPLPENATEVMTGEGEMSADAITYERGGLVARAALPPGERMFVVRYTLSSPEVDIPTPGTTELFDILVREPAPPLDIAGLPQAESVQLESGGTYRTYAAEGFTMPFLRVALGEEPKAPPVQWIAVMLALTLASAGVLALRGSSSRLARVRGDVRQNTIVELARLDEEFESRRSPTPEVREEYQRRRAELMRRLKSGR